MAAILLGGERPAVHEQVIASIPRREVVCGMDVGTERGTILSEVDQIVREDVLRARFLPLLLSVLSWWRDLRQVGWGGGLWSHCRHIFRKNQGRFGFSDYLVERHMWGSLDEVQAVVTDIDNCEIGDDAVDAACPR